MARLKKIYLDHTIDNGMKEVFMIRKWTLVVFVNLLIILFLLTSLELFVRYRNFKSFSLPVKKIVANELTHYGYNPEHKEYLGGIRGGPVPIEKDSNEFRIMCLGGSTTAGYGIEDVRDTWPYQVEKFFSQDRSQKIRVINGAVLGFGTRHIIKRLEKWVPQYKPDLIIFYEGWNGIGLLSDSVSAAGVDLGIIDPQDGFLTRIDKRLQNHLFSYHRFKRLLQRNALLKRINTYEAYKKYEGIEQNSELWAKDIEQIIRICKSNHWPIVLIAFPSAIPVQNRFENWINWRLNFLKQIKEEPGSVHVYDMTQSLGSSQKEKESYFIANDIMHKNKLGCKKFAEALSDSLKFDAKNFGL